MLKRKTTYAAVLAIWPKRPGPWGAAWVIMGWGGAAAAGGGAAMVVAGRCGWGAGAEAVGREGARPTER